jgi:myo-inositol-1(or 4)-monophosphatase
MSMIANFDHSDFLEETLRLVSNELISRFGSQNNVRQKSDATLVTDADFAAEKLILERLFRYFPDDAIISEESGKHRFNRQPGQHVWVVDPLDGTTNFAHSYPYFCSSIARCLVRKDGSLGSILAGIVDPVRSKYYIASEGGGAVCNHVPMRVSPFNGIEHSFLVTGLHWSDDEKRMRAEIDRYYRIAKTCHSIRRDGAAALDLAMVAEGVFDGFWEQDLSIWDVAAGCLLVSESGGSLSNYPLLGEPTNAALPELLSISLENRTNTVLFDMEAPGIIAGSQVLVQKIFELL